MESRSTRKKFKELFRGLFNKGDKGHMSDDERRDASTSSLPADDPPVVVAIHAPPCGTLPIITAQRGILNNASNIVMQNPSMVDQSTTVNNYHQQPADAARAMKQLFNHILPGAAHNSSARDPPPRCHPDTRIRINERIIYWFYDTDKKEWLLWINGLAGVGKSAIVQTLAENLALAKHLGASVFISRPRKCNDSKRFFLTIAYQLAQHIEAYYSFITTKLARDPELVNRGMEEQFQTFIVEPFVEKKIGADGHSWAILVDGLDELDTRQGQQEIIRLISSFVLEHPRTPLTWVIASRPEPHILAAFGQKIASSYTKEEIPIDSDEACADVECYLNSSFETIRSNFPLIVPGDDWPNQQDVWQVTHAASGLFTFAEIVVRFVGDMDHADPVTRLKDVLLAIDHAKAGAFDDWPFAYLDSLHTHILESISPKLWPTTKRVFSILVLDSESAQRWYIHTILEYISFILGVDLGMIYASFNNCTSILKIPPREGASESAVAFYHASFGDYLLDSTRSGRFHISKEDAKEEVCSSLIRLWQHFQAHFPPGLEYSARRDQFWREGAPELSEKSPWIDPLIRISEVFAYVLVEKHTKREGYFESDDDRDRCFDLLKQLDSSTVCQGSYDTTARFVDWVFEIWTAFGEELASRGIICEVPFEQIRLDHLEWPTLYPFYAYAKNDVLARDLEREEMFSRETCSREEDISGIKEFQQRCPQLPVLICGCSGKRFAFLKDPKPSHGIRERYSGNSDCYGDALRYYIIPYPDSQNPKQFLRAKFVTIREKFSEIVPISWPTEADFRKLADAASGQYVLASMAIRFIEDHNHANPVSRLEEILSIVDGQSDETPCLDALYTHVLCSIPSAEWQIMQRVLGALLCIERGSLMVHDISFEGMCEILALDEDMVYALFNLYSLATVLPEPRSTGYRNVVFYHTSFADYLTDPTRSKDFHISVESAREDVLWSMSRENDRENKRLPISSSVSNHSKFAKYIPDALLDLLVGDHDPGQQGGPFVSQEDRDRCFEMLGQLNAGIVCTNFFEARHFRRLFPWVFDIWKMFQEELAERTIIHQVELAQLRFDHLDQGEDLNCCTCTRDPGLVEYRLMPFKDFSDCSDLESYQQACPQLPVLICGSPGSRFALFEYQYTDADLTKWPKVFKRPTSGLYIIACPDEM